jgi:hypothetical protein
MNNQNNPVDYAKDVEFMEYINKYHIHDQSYTYKDLKLTCEQDYDYAVIIDNVFVQDFFDKSKTIVFRCEPNLLRQRFPEYVQKIHYNDFFKTYDGMGIWEGLGNGLGVNDSVFYNYKFDKTKVLSSICSNLNWHDLHQKRLDFLYKLDTLPYFDHYGYEYACVPNVNFKNLKSHVQTNIADKWEAMAPYKYNFNADNVREPNSFSERITQALLMECLLFYDGGTTVEDIIDGRAFIRVNLDDQEHALHVVKTSIENNEYEKRIDIIRQEKLKVLDKLSLMELTYNAIHGIKNFFEV